jgi:hypothetical protein
MLLGIMRVISLVFVVVCLVGSGSGQGRDSSANGEFISGAYGTAKAMAMAYGSYDSKSESSVWTPKQEAAYSQYWPDQVRVHSLSDFSYVGGGVRRHLLVTWARPDEDSPEGGDYSCHACGVLLGATAFKEVEGGWKAEASNLQLDRSGAWGQPPVAKLLKVGRNAFGLAIQTDDMHQGEVEQHLSIYGPVSGVFTKWFDAQIANLDPNHEYDKTCGGVFGTESGTCVWYRSAYSLEPWRGAEVYDLVLRKRVTRTFSKKVHVGVFVQRFHFDGAQYVSLSKPD